MNKPYTEKREYLLASGIPYLTVFAEKYENFDEESIEERTKEIVGKLKSLYLISMEDVEKQYLKLQGYFELKKQLIIAFGKESDYVNELTIRGIDKFIQYIYKNGALPGHDKKEIEKYIKMQVESMVLLTDNT